jgi:tRNA U34 5-methylaminomethyl-2-thiouridine-forming methyltransferase MnmC
LSTDRQHIVKPVETKDGSLTLISERFGATYHATQGAKEESRHVFINNGLLRFRAEHSRTALKVLEIGFGTGLNTFLTFLEARRLGLVIDYQAVELYPVPMEIAKQLNFTKDYSSDEETVFLRMHEQAWNETHPLSETFHLTKHLAKAETFRAEQKFDLIYFDAFSPKEQPELWTKIVFRNMYSLLSEPGMLVTYCAQGQMKRNMKAVGFQVKALKGFAVKREMTVAYRS